MTADALPQRIRVTAARPVAPGRTTRAVIVTVACLAAVLGLGVLAIVVGSSTLTVPDALRTLAGSGTPGERLIVLELRMPRVAAALSVGACLGLAGALTQTFARNPLATPDILGVTSGAGLGGVAAILLAGGSYAVSAPLLALGVPAAAALGAILTAAVVYGLSWRRGIDGYRLILVGIGATAVLTGITSWLIVRAQISGAAEASHWLVGSLNGVSWSSVLPGLIVLAALAPIAGLLRRELDVSTLGDDLSTGLGVPIQRHRALVVLCAVLLTAAAVAAAGPVGFVAFVAPQIARRVVGSGRPPLLASALLGALVVIGADTLSRAVLPDETPVGIVTTVVGAPYLIWLLTRRGTDRAIA